MTRVNQTLLVLGQIGVSCQTTISWHFQSIPYMNIMKSRTQIHHHLYRLVGNKRLLTSTAIQSSMDEDPRILKPGEGTKRLQKRSHLLGFSDELDPIAPTNQLHSTYTSFPQNDRYKLQFDGGSRGNPGEGGYGFVLIHNPSGEKIGQGYGYFERATNNEAEYNGLLSGLKYAQKLGIHNLDVEGDSLLVVKQMLGEYAVKAMNLKPLNHEAVLLAKYFQNFTIRYIPRKDNALADQLANEAMDRRASLDSSI